jgi:hypothetical protein
MRGWLMNNELEKMWKKAVVACFNVLLQRLPSRAEGNHKIPVRKAGLHGEMRTVHLRTVHLPDMKQEY